MANEIKATFEEMEQTFECTFEDDQEFDARMDGILPGDYTGSYEVTPSAEIQTLPTSGKLLTLDVVVNPIPSNYGLITWDGSTITVS